MNINCVICSDLLTPQAEVFVTPCGHIFHHHCLLNWLKRSKTCPQCRNKTTTSSIHRIYFNLANSEGVSEDAGVLQFKVDNLEYQMKLMDKDVQTYKEKYKKAKLQTDGLRAEVARLEDTERSNNSVMLHFKDQIHFFKKKSKEVDKLNEEMFQLRHKIKDMENVETAMKGSSQDMENILKNENNVESLALLASTLKKSLVDSELKRRNIQLKFSHITVAHSRCDKTISELKCKCESLRKDLETTRVNHEKEVRFLKDKYEQLHTKLSSSEQLSQSVNNSIQRIILESPVNYNTPVLKPMLKNVNELFTPETKNVKESSTSALGTPVLVSKNDVAGGLRKKTINHRSRLDLEQHSSLFRSQGPPKPNIKPCEVVYDGLGGSCKEDIFPQPIKTTKALKRSKTGGSVSAAKFKKLSPGAGQKKKVTDFFDS